ncbi:hypothetical protein, partial [Aeromonas veronii]|uniref:hypothetical protein n=1 Tax=Aeromonas veronii TaxID=654 RepID=UPI00195685E4
CIEHIAKQDVIANTTIGHVIAGPQQHGNLIPLGQGCRQLLGTGHNLGIADRSIETLLDPDIVYPYLSIP